MSDTPDYDKIVVKTEAGLLSELDFMACTGASTSMPPVTLDSLREAASKFKAIQREHHRKEALFIESFKCSICGRGATVTNAGFGDEWNVCEHAIAWLDKLPRVEAGPSLFPSTLLGLRFVALEDGPARW